MKSIIIAAMLLPYLSFGQKESSPNDMVYNVYRRDASVIIKYNKEFIEDLKHKGEIISSNDSVYTTLTIQHTLACLDDVTFYVDLVTEAKDNRTRISFNNPRYKYNGDKCPKEGTLQELRDCPKCSMGSGILIDEYRKYRQAMYLKYHSFLRSKNKDKENW